MLFPAARRTVTAALIAAVPLLSRYAVEPAIVLGAMHLSQQSIRVTHPSHPYELTSKVSHPSQPSESRI